MTDFTCSDFKELIFDYIDGELNAEEVDKFENHMKNCTGDCDEEFQKVEKMMNSVRDSRYVIDGKLYAALVPQIEIESKKIRMDNMLRNIRRYGSVGIAAMIMIVVLVYFTPISDIVNKSSLSDSGMDIAIAEDAEIAANVKDTVVYAEIDISPTGGMAVPGALIALPPVEPAEPSEMIDYLNAYVPDYVTETEVLYISHNEVNLPEGVIAEKFITNPECSVYVINRFSNADFNISEATDYDTLYDTSESGKAYIVIIAFNSDET